MAPDHPTICIAVVDDDESFCRSMERLLRAANLQPVTYASAEAFLADRQRPHLDCLMLDIELGGISGLELNRRLQASGSTTPIIYLTAHDEVATRAAAAACGCAAFVSKLQPGNALLSVIRAVLHIPPDATH
jgi:FixJ family two-component response regulator